MDLYYPVNASEGVKLPAVIFVCGYSISRILELAGNKFKDMPQYKSWGKLIAKIGFIGITYNAEHPENNINTLFAFLRKNASLLGIDTEHICLWSCSGNSLLAISILMQESNSFVKSAVFYYGILFDQEIELEIGKFARKIGFDYPSTLKNTNLSLQKIPLLIVRAGLEDSAVINRSIDLCLNKIISLNYPVQFINYPSGQHGFDVLDDHIKSRNIIESTLEFIKNNFQE